MPSILPQLFAGREPGLDSPAVGRIPPLPISTRTAPLAVGGRRCTVIARRWRPGDPARCRLCDRCSVPTDAAGAPACVIIVAREVRPAAAPLFATAGLREFIPAVPVSLAVPHFEGGGPR